MKGRYKIILVISALATALGCSRQWKEGSANLSGDEVIEKLQSLATSGAASGDSSSVYNFLIDQSDTNVYIGEGPSDMGPAHSIMSFVDYSLFSSQDADLSAFDLENATVVFLDGFDESKTRRFVLALEYSVNGSSRSFKASDEGFSFSKNKFEAQFTGNNGQKFLLRSYNLRDGEEDFGSFIQLKVFVLDGNGETYIGKFSTLAGYGT